MSQADLSQAPLTEPSEREWELLSNTIDFANAFWIIFLFPNDRYPANIILHRIRRIEQDPPLHLVELTFDQPEDLRELLPRVLAAPPDALLWCAAMAHETPEWRRAWVYYSQRWNEHREVLRRARTGGLLLVASPWVKPLMQSMAPDLWSIRTLSLDPTAPAPISAPQEPLQPLAILEPKSLSQPPVSDSRRALALQQAQRALSQPDDPPLDAFLRLGASLQPLMDAQAWDTLRQVAQRAHVAYHRWTAQLHPIPDYNLSAEIVDRLFTLGLAWRELGQREEALEMTHEAAQKYRDLAKDRPDAFLPDLAMSLNNMGAMFFSLGRREEALEATQESAQIRRELTKNSPEKFLPDLALSLNNLGNRLASLGRKEEALEATQESEQILRELARNRPENFLPALAISLNSMGNQLYLLDKKEEALEATQEAAQILRELVKDRPDAFLPDLALSLNNLGNRLSSLGKKEEALEAAQEAAQIRRDLAKDRSDAFLPDLAMSLNNLGNRLSELGRREEALEATKEAVGLCVPLVQRWPKAMMQDFVRALQNLLKRLDEAGVDPETDEVLLAATKVFEDLNLGEGSG